VSRRKKLGECLTAFVHLSLTVPPDLYVTVVLPNNGKFKVGDKVQVGVVHFKDWRESEAQGKREGTR
jgi:hypothetical protein